MAVPPLSGPRQLKKTTSGMLTRMILDAYVPAMSEFAAGKVKTNAPHLLFEFQKVFNLQESS